MVISPRLVLLCPEVPKAPSVDEDVGCPDVRRIGSVDRKEIEICF